MLLKPHSRIQVMEGAKHNLPDRDAMKAARAIQDLAGGLQAEDLLLVLISGNASEPSFLWVLPRSLLPVLLPCSLAALQFLLMVHEGRL